MKKLNTLISSSTRSAKRVSAHFFTLFLLFCFFSFYVYAQDSVTVKAKREFRGVWIATVTNIDYPYQPTTDAELLKAEFISLIDLHKRNGMNAVVFQIRPSADAFYPSPFEPWSNWLTGAQGQAPDPVFDPLEFMIEETHKRGMEFHAWLNPYRAVFNRVRDVVSPDHITRKHPEWFINYGDKKYFDPGNPEARKYLVGVVRDIVTRYNVDAIHFDDYFYPYPIAGTEFPDYSTYKIFGKGMSRGDWRRSNTDSIISNIHDMIKEVRPECQFGISPFGVWRNKDRDPEGSNTQRALTNYDDLYADILNWLDKGWIDYVAPQLYWNIGHRNVDFSHLVDWWNAHTYGRNCYIGIGYYQVGSNAAWKDLTQIPRQIEKVRSAENVQGMIFYHSRAFESDPYGISKQIREYYFKEPALPPLPPDN
jgi:uncharacterized lipoprotein YddW (UPF0748 family)